MIPAPWALLVGITALARLAGASARLQSEALPLLTAADWRAAPPQRRYFAPMASVDALAVGYGGESGCYAAIGAGFGFDGLGKVWSRRVADTELPGQVVSPALPGLRNHRQVLLFGGIDIRGNVHGGAFLLDAVGGAWLRADQGPAAPKGAGYAAFSDGFHPGSGLIFGGAFVDGISDQFWEASRVPGTERALTWRALRPAGPAQGPGPRYWHAAARSRCANAFVTFGGLDAAGAFPDNATWVALPANATHVRWQRFSPLDASPPLRRARTALAGGTAPLCPPEEVGAGAAGAQRCHRRLLGGCGAPPPAQPFHAARGTAASLGDGPATAPLVRLYAGMAAIDAEGEGCTPRVALFGGSRGPHDVLGDTWLLEGAPAHAGSLFPWTWSWRRLRGAAPPARQRHSIAGLLVSSSRAVGSAAGPAAIVFGGVGTGNRLRNDAWLLVRGDGWGWRMLSEDTGGGGGEGGGGEGGGGPPLPVGREQHSAAAWNATAALIYGGRPSGGPCLNDTWLAHGTPYAPGLLWRRLPALSGEGPGCRVRANLQALRPCAPGAGTCALVPARALLLCFGRGEQPNDIYGDCWLAAPAGSALPADPGPWHPLSTAPGSYVPRPRYSAAAATLGGDRVAFYGGYFAAATRDMLNQTLVAEVDVGAATLRWHVVAAHGAGPPALANSRMAPLGAGRALLFGGELQDAQMTGDSWLLACAPSSPAAPACAWSRLAPSPSPPARFGHMLVAGAHAVWLGGGNNGFSALADTWAFDPRGLRWRKVAPEAARAHLGLPPAPHGAGLLFVAAAPQVVRGREAVVITGGVQCSEAGSGTGATLVASILWVNSTAAPGVAAPPLPGRRGGRLRAPRAAADSSQALTSALLALQDGDTLPLAELPQCGAAGACNISLQQTLTVPQLQGVVLAGAGVVTLLCRMPAEQPCFETTRGNGASFFTVLDSLTLVDARPAAAAATAGLVHAGTASALLLSGVRLVGSRAGGRGGGNLAAAITVDRGANVTLASCDVAHFSRVAAGQRPVCDSGCGGAVEMQPPGDPARFDTRVRLVDTRVRDCTAPCGGALCLRGAGTVLELEAGVEIESNAAVCLATNAERLPTADGMPAVCGIGGGVLAWSGARIGVAAPGLRVRSNRADVAGGGLLCGTACAAGFLPPRPSEGFLASWTGNEAGRYGPDAATGATGIRLAGAGPIGAVSPGAVLSPPPVFVVTDHFGQRFAAPALHALEWAVSAQAGLQSPCALDGPSLAHVNASGYATFPALSVRGPYGARCAFAAVLAGSGLPAVQGATAAVSLVPCPPGSSLDVDVCAPCPAGSYALRADDPCLPCPQDAACAGGMNVTTYPGYWGTAAAAAGGDGQLLVSIVGCPPAQCTPRAGASGTVPVANGTAPPTRAAWRQVCVGNRVGILCGSCMAGFRPQWGAEGACVRADRCLSREAAGGLFALLCLAYATFLVFTASASAGAVLELARAPSAGPGPRDPAAEVAVCGGPPATGAGRSGASEVRAQSRASLGATARTRSGSQGGVQLPLHPSSDASAASLATVREETLGGQQFLTLDSVPFATEGGANAGAQPGPAPEPARHLTIPADRGFILTALYFWQLAATTLDATQSSALRSVLAAGKAAGLDFASALGSSSGGGGGVALCARFITSPVTAIATSLAGPPAIVGCVALLHGASACFHRASRAAARWRIRAQRAGLRARCAQGGSGMRTALLEGDRGTKGGRAGAGCHAPGPQLPAAAAVTAETAPAALLLANRAPASNGRGRGSARCICGCPCPAAVRRLRVVLPTLDGTTWAGSYLLCGLLGFQTTVRTLAKLLHCQEVPLAGEGGRPLSVLYFAGDARCDAWWHPLAMGVLALLSAGPVLLALALRRGARVVRAGAVAGPPTAAAGLAARARRVADCAANAAYLSSGRPFRAGSGWWPAVQLAERFLFAVLAAGVRDLAARLLMLVLVVGASLLVHVWRRPYRDRGVGATASALQALLLLLCVVSLPMALNLEATGGAARKASAEGSDDSATAHTLHRFAEMCAVFQEILVAAAAAVCSAAAIYLALRSLGRRAWGPPTRTGAGDGTAYTRWCCLR